jgi:hypothetical protein
MLAAVLTSVAELPLIGPVFLLYLHFEGLGVHQ